MTMAFTNLIYNAAQKFNDNDKISIQYDDHDTSHIIKIIYSGNPIPDNVLSRIFEPFFTTKQKCTELCLVIYNAIIGINDDSMTVKNNHVAFTIVLPKSLI